MWKLIYYTGGALLLLIPRPFIRAVKMREQDGGNLYMLHIGARWMGYTFMISLSSTDNRPAIRRAIDHTNQD